VGALQAEVTAGLQVWEAVSLSITSFLILSNNHQDGNRGLASTLAESIPRFCIIDLSKRFTSVPILKIASYPHVNATPELTLQYIRQLIDAGELQAEITTSKTTNEPVLHFTQSNITYRSESELQTLIGQEIDTVKTLASLVRLADAKQMISKDFVGLTRRSREEQMGALLTGDKGAEAGVPNDWEDEANLLDGFGQGGEGADEIDEDIMEDS
jgi:hypothetical protein